MKRFSIVDRGYDIDEINRFIYIVISRLEKLNTENATYLAKIDKLNQQIQKNGNNQYDVNRLEKAILAVQETSDRIKEISKEEARVIVEEAKNNANSIIHEALIKAEKIEHERVILEKNMKIYKEKAKSLIETQLKLVEDFDKNNL